MGLKQNLHTLKEKYKGTKMAPAFNALHTFLYTPNETTHSGSHVRVVDDLKRTMNTVIMALIPCLIFGILKKHEVEDGYLVTGMLVPLIVPIDIPLWMLTVAVIFGVVIGKEVFGGTGMNILNPALTIRAFLFFAYPTWMSGDKVWVHG